MLVTGDARCNRRDPVYSTSEIVRLAITSIKFNIYQIYLVTARVAKVMFSQACVTHSVQRRGGGEVGNTKGHNTSPLPVPGHNTSPPPPGPGHNTSPPPSRTRSQHLPPDYAQAGSTHPTGMHSSYLSFSILKWSRICQISQRQKSPLVRLYLTYLYL